MADAEHEKALAARHSLRFVRDGMVIGLGTGSTAAHVVRLLGQLVRDGVRIAGVPTSEQAAALARANGVPLLSPEEVDAIDVTIDGADEVLANGDAIKGAGGALVREKIVATASRQVVLVVDASKLVERLGRGPLPVEVVPFGWSFVARQLVGLDLEPTLRRGDDGGIHRTDNGNYILDARLRDGAALPDAATLQAIPGVVGHGLFVGIADRVVIGRGDEVEELIRPRD